MARPPHMVINRDDGPQVQRRRCRRALGTLQRPAVKARLTDLGPERLMALVLAGLVREYNLVQVLLRETVRLPRRFKHANERAPNLRNYHAVAFDRIVELLVLRRGELALLVNQTFVHVSKFDPVLNKFALCSSKTSPPTYLPFSPSPQA